MRVFFDASVIIAALLSPNGGSALLIKYINLGKIIGITSQTAIDEILEEDIQDKIKRSKGQIEQFISQSNLVVREKVTVDEIAPYQGQVDVEDAHLIAGATSTKCSYLVTLDKKHLLQANIQKRFLPLKIVSPKEILEEIVSK